MDIKLPINKIAIIGCGLIGGSIGLNLSKQGFASQIQGYDLNASRMEQALAQGAVDSIGRTSMEAVENADLIIVATPVGHIIPTIHSFIDCVKQGAVITDVGSTKGYIVEQIESFLDEGIHFVGGHPMAGSEESGMNGADPYLFENAVYILTPSENTREYPIKLVEKMVSCIGAQVLHLRPERHDRIAASVSHLPHMLAVTLVNTVAKVAESDDNILALAAGGFRDTTRVASGNVQMWMDIIKTNRQSIIEQLIGYEENVKLFKEYIQGNDLDNLEELLLKAQTVRQSIPAKKKGFLTPIYEMVVMVVDEPGAISSVTQLLGKSSINIKDIEILRVREGDGGSLRLGFGTMTELDNAVDVLVNKGYSVKTYER